QQDVRRQERAHLFSARVGPKVCKPSHEIFRFVHTCPLLWRDVTCPRLTAPSAPAACWVAPSRAHGHLTSSRLMTVGSRSLSVITPPLSPGTNRWLGRGSRIGRAKTMRRPGAGLGNFAFTIAR